MKKGSSLLEVLVVVSILSLLLTVTLPRFSYIQKYKEKRKIEEICINTIKARRLALDSSRAMTIVFQENNYRLLKKEEEIYQNSYGEDISLDQAKEIRLVFTRNGRPDNQSAQTIIFKGKYNKYALVVAPVTGQVRWEVKE